MIEDTRGFCFRCLKPQVTCYCADLKTFRTQATFVLLQHPLERRTSVGTARMTHLCIQGSHLIAGAEFEDHARVNALIADPAHYCVVLYPGPQSTDIGLLGAEELRAAFPRDKQLVIFVIDGSWPCAVKMLSRSPNLKRLPRICFTPTRASEYQFRRQPQPHCLSTIEATHRVLEIMEPSVDAGILLTLFRKMVAQQVIFSKRKRFRRVMKNGPERTSA